jgi:hypothetical protein
MQLGLTETTARNYVISQIHSPVGDRRNEIAVFGTRAFQKLPSAARGTAAAALFAWAKAYVNSAAFKTTYATIRKQTIPSLTPTYTDTIDEAVQKLINVQREMVESVRKVAAGLPPSDAKGALEQAKEIEDNLKDPAYLKRIRENIEVERAATGENNNASVQEAEAKYPADPQKIFAQRLREFLKETANVNFSAKTISLTGGPDGIEFVHPEDRARSWLWQEAVIVGPEAVAAARAAAEAWLKELEP